MGNASRLWSKQATYCLASLRLVSAPHLPYSPDLAASDFYLSGKAKNLLIGKKFASAGDLLHEVSKILEIIGRDGLNSVFANGKCDYKNASLWTESMWTKHILKMAAFL
jgi:hypothetical protein